MINRILESKFNRIELQRNWINEYISGVESSRLNKRPFPGKWSVLEIVQHIYISEKLTQDYLKKKLSFAPELKKAGFFTWIRFRLLIFSRWQPVKLKAPQIADVHNENIDPAELAGLWSKQREELFDFLQSLPDPVFKAEFYKHPVAGKMRLDHMLRFFYHHTKRHIGQIKRISI